MRIILFLLLGLCILSVPAFAVDPITNQALITSSDVLRGHFTEERQMKGFNAPLRSQGHFVVAPTHGLIWAIEKPFPTTSTITPNGLSQDIGGIKVMQIPVKKIPFLLHLYDMLGGVLAGHWQVLEKDFILTPINNADGWEVTLQPRDAGNPSLPFQTIVIKGNRFAETALLQKADGDFDLITFMDQTLVSAPPTRAETAAFNSVGP